MKMRLGVFVVGAAAIVGFIVATLLGREPLVTYFSLVASLATLAARYLAHKDDGQPIRFSSPRFRIADRGAGLAAWLAGRKRNLGQAWRADLLGDPSGDSLLSRGRKFRLVSGFFWSALRYRVHDMARPFMHPVDWVLKTRGRREVLVTLVVGVHAITIVRHDGLYTLISTGWTWMAMSGGAAWGLLHWLGKRRGLELASNDEPSKG
ncbi:hypothetical protein ACWDCL_28160 [Streptomyces sp. NPDC001009]